MSDAARIFTRVNPLTRGLQMLGAALSLRDADVPSELAIQPIIPVLDVSQRGLSLVNFEMYQGTGAASYSILTNAAGGAAAHVDGVVVTHLTIQTPVPEAADSWVTLVAPDGTRSIYIGYAVSTAAAAGRKVRMTDLGMPNRVYVPPGWGLQVTYNGAGNASVSALLERYPAGLAPLSI